MACVRACPGGAISRTRTVSVEVAGQRIEWGEIDCERCDLYFRGGEPVADPREPGRYITGQEGYRPKAISPFYTAPPKVYNAGKAICGAGGCTRACIASLEQRDALTRKFKQPFRRRPPWRIDWSNYAAEIEALPQGTVGINTKLDTD